MNKEMAIITVKEKFDGGEVETTFRLWPEPGGWNVVIMNAEGDPEEASDPIEILAGALPALIGRFPDHIRPSVINDCAKAFVNAASIGIGLTEPEWMFDPLSDLKKDPEALAHVLLQIVGSLGNPDTEKLNNSGALCAIRAGEILGPDWAQILYRFAVTATKFA